MAVYTNSSSSAVKVMFKVAGKTYNNGTGESQMVDTAASTFYPFDEVLVAAGAAVELGDYSIVRVAVMGPEAQAVVDRVGDDGDITNNGANPLKVIFKVDGKVYGNGTGESTMIDSVESTFYAFDEAIVPAGKKFNSAGAKVIKTVELVPGADLPSFITDVYRG